MGNLTGTGSTLSPGRRLLIVGLAPLLPQILGSIFNIWYNTAVIGPMLDARLKERFEHTVLVFNLIAYPIAVGLWLFLLLSLLPTLRAVAAGQDNTVLPLILRRVIHLPWWGGLLAGCTWLACIPTFLISLAATGDRLDPSLYIHFPVSFLVSALIASTQSFFLVEICSHRLLLPVIFRNTPAHAQGGTLKVTVRGRGLLWLISAAICPISSLVLLSFAPPHPGADPQWFALFVGSVGIAFGLCTALMISRLVAEPIELLSGSVKKVAAGHLDIQISENRPDEFGLLISEFNRMIRELRAKEELRQTFGLHVGRAIAERILAQDPGLSGAEETITVLFCDIRNYTARCASQAPGRIVGLLNAFFSDMVQIVEEKHGGMVNQFTGDGFMALFGASGVPAHHADAALAAARDMLVAVTAFNARTAEAVGEPLALGIGLHTGPAVVGTVGSPRRMTFTAIGSTVNLAARVEQLSKTVARPIVFTQATRDALTQPVPLESLPAQHVKGLTDVIEIFTVA